jgi:hypothetical protein
MEAPNEGEAGGESNGKEQHVVELDQENLKQESTSMLPVAPAGAIQPQKAGAGITCAFHLNEIAPNPIRSPNLKTGLSLAHSIRV